MSRPTVNQVARRTGALAATLTHIGLVTKRRNSSRQAMPVFVDLPFDGANDLETAAVPTRHPFLRQAIEARLQILSGRAEADVEAHVTHLDLESFTTPEGHIDESAIAQYAEVFKAKTPALNARPFFDPIREAIIRENKLAETQEAQP